MKDKLIRSNARVDAAPDLSILSFGSDGAGLANAHQRSVERNASVDRDVAGGHPIRLLEQKFIRTRA